MIFVSLSVLRKTILNPEYYVFMRELNVCSLMEFFSANFGSKLSVANRASELGLYSLC